MLRSGGVAESDSNGIDNLLGHPDGSSTCCILSVESSDARGVVRGSEEGCGGEGCGAAQLDVNRRDLNANAREDGVEYILQTAHPLVVTLCASVR